MSYPPDHPPAAASFVAAGNAPTVLIGSTTAHFVATGATTAGEFGLFRWDMPPTAGGATPHYHRTFSESFFVLDGRIEVYDGTRWREATAGDFLHVRPNGVHGFRNGSGEPASMLILFAPGPPREEYFRELADRITSGREFSAEERAAFLARHDQYEV